MDWMPQAIRDGIFTVLFISGPMVLLAAALGLVIGIIQAATQVQEQTLGSAVKILGVFLALIVFGFYMFQYLKQYTSQTINRAFNLVPTLSSHPLPPKKLLKQPIKKEEETDHPLFSPEELAETAPATGGGASNAAKEANAAAEEAEVVEVLPEPNTDKLPQINYLTRPPSGIKEAIYETFAPPEETNEEEHPEDHEHAEATQPAAAQTQRPASQPQRQAARPAATTQARPSTQAPRPTSQPVQQQARPTTTQQAQARPNATAQAPRPAQTTRPAAKPAPRPVAQPVAAVEEVAPPIVTPATSNADLDASRSRARAALARIKSSINEVEQGAAAAE